MVPEYSKSRSSTNSTRESSERQLQSTVQKSFLPGVPSNLGASPELPDYLSPIQGEGIVLCWLTRSIGPGHLLAFRTWQRGSSGEGLRWQPHLGRVPVPHLRGPGARCSSSSRLCEQGVRPDAPILIKAVPLMEAVMLFLYSLVNSFTLSSFAAFCPFRFFFSSTKRRWWYLSWWVTVMINGEVSESLPQVPPPESTQ